MRHHFFFSFFFLIFLWFSVATPLLEAANVRQALDAFNRAQLIRMVKCIHCNQQVQSIVEVNMFFLTSLWDIKRTRPLVEADQVNLLMQWMSLSKMRPSEQLRGIERMQESVLKDSLIDAFQQLQASPYRRRLVLVLKKNLPSEEPYKQLFKQLQAQQVRPRAANAPGTINVSESTRSASTTTTAAERKMTRKQAARQKAELEAFSTQLSERTRKLQRKELDGLVRCFQCFDGAEGAIGRRGIKDYVLDVAKPNPASDIGVDKLLLGMSGNQVREALHAFWRDVKVGEFKTVGDANKAAMNAFVTGQVDYGTLVSTINQTKKARTRPGELKGTDHPFEPKAKRVREITPEKLPEQTLTAKQREKLRQQEREAIVARKAEEKEARRKAQRAAESAAEAKKKQAQLERAQQKFDDAVSKRDRAGVKESNKDRAEWFRQQKRQRKSRENWWKEWKENLNRPSGVTHPGVVMERREALKALQRRAQKLIEIPVDRLTAKQAREMKSILKRVNAYSDVMSWKQLFAQSSEIRQLYDRVFLLSPRVQKLLKANVSAMEPAEFQKYQGALQRTLDRSDARALAKYQTVSIKRLRAHEQSLRPSM